MRKTLVAISVALLIGGCSHARQKPKQQILKEWLGGGAFNQDAVKVGNNPLWMACGLTHSSLNEYMEKGWTVKSITPYTYPLGNNKNSDYVCTVASVLLEK